MARTALWAAPLLAAYGWLAPGPAAASDIRLLSTMNIRPALDALIAPFAAASGHRVIIESQGAASTRERAAAGEGADAVINSRTTLDLLASQGRIVPGSIVDIAHSSIGIVVRSGSPKPDIATDDALKHALLAAKSISYPDPAGGSLGGTYFAQLLTRLGIADEIARKSTLTGGGAACGRVVAAGDAELGVNQIAELLPVSGIEFLAPLPPALQNKVVMAAGIATSAKESAAAAEWIRFLASPAAAAALEADGMTP